MSHPSLKSARILAVAIVPLFAACSSSTTEPGTQNLSASEAGAVVSALFTQVFTGFTQSSAFDRGRAGLVMSRAAASGSARARSAALTTVTFTSACQLGGDITATETETGGLDENGTGTYGGTLTYTPRGCVVSTGSRNVTVDGDPSMTMVMNMPFTAGQWSGNATFRITGGFRWSGGGCQINYSAVVSPNGHSTITGTVCGQSVNETY